MIGEKKRRLSCCDTSSEDDRFQSVRGMEESLANAPKPCNLNVTAQHSPIYYILGPTGWSKWAEQL